MIVLEWSEDLARELWEEEKVRGHHDPDEWVRSIKKLVDDGHAIVGRLPNGTLALKLTEKGVKSAEQIKARDKKDGV